MTAPALKTFILGGTRSGKSRFAERLVGETGLERLYIATAQPFDDEMAARIERHREARATGGWRTIEEPLRLPEIIDDESRPDRAILVDCLTLWISNLMMAERDVTASGATLVASIGKAPGPIALVSNEVGLGGIQTNEMARAFADHAGRLHQELAAVAGQVVFMAAGLPIWVKRP